MVKPLSYLLVPVMSLLLVSAQGFWGSAVKNDKPFDQPVGRIFISLITNPKIWVGVGLYIVATAVYFVLLSRHKFFAVQIGLAALAIIFSTLLSALLFHERLSMLNITGMCLVLVGLGLVFTD